MQVEGRNDRLKDEISDLTICKRMILSVKRPGSIQKYILFSKTPPDVFVDLVFNFTSVAHMQKISHKNIVFSFVWC
mgnify:CR=1 FL=1